MITKKMSVALPVILVTALIFTNGCLKKVSTSELDETRTNSSGTTSDVSQSGGLLNGGDLVAVTEPSTPAADVSGDSMAGDKSLSSNSSNKDVKDIFFDFDEYTLRDESKSKLQDNASLLKVKKVKKVVIEGHCDERGTNEYNLALGERRAQSTKRYLTALGINPSNISTISFGEEKLFCSEQNEDCWQKNRRAHFILQENGS
ncbi:MAG: peptidoglycan-associated lipoprotein Pal [Nitrospirae bacterium]|nr:peptidoglycan-associated lipoprotein Pal [Nitrospirota bacterium]